MYAPIHYWSSFIANSVSDNFLPTDVGNGCILDAEKDYFNTYYFCKKFEGYPLPNEEEIVITTGLGAMEYLWSTSECTS